MFGAKPLFRELVSGIFSALATEIMAIFPLRSTQRRFSAHYSLPASRQMLQACFLLEMSAKICMAVAWQSHGGRHSTLYSVELPQIAAVAALSRNKWR